MKDTWNMTPDEARKYILQNWFDVDKFECGDKEYTAMAIAVEALEATKWHYPSKGEYPIEDEEILCKVPCNHYAVGKYNKTFDYFDFETTRCTPVNIECWQYIVPPKEEV